MSTTIRLALAQVNPTVGDIDANAAKILDFAGQATNAGADLVVFPELALCGYPPEDLLLRTSFLDACRAKLDSLAADLQRVGANAALVGFPELDGDVYNSVAVVAAGAVRGTYRKCNLPNYGVFDENRYFQAGSAGTNVKVGRATLGLTICEDVWQPGPPLTDEALAGAQAIVNISASPFHQGKGRDREQMIAQRARDNISFIAFCNLVGGQDELVFDGYSLVVDPHGRVLARAPQFVETLLVADIDVEVATAMRLRDARRRPMARNAKREVAQLEDLPQGAQRQARSELSVPLAPPMSEEEEVYEALVVGTRDYVAKNAFHAVLIGLSGGIDSAMVACVAVDALGADHVKAAVMPSPYSSEATQSDAVRLARNLGIECFELPIEPAMVAFDSILHDAFLGTEPGVSEENIQARIRGTILMALSNKFGWLVLTTGNKSEYAVGYTTLYGDMAGGFAVLKDVPKTWVYRLARYRNRHEGRDEIPSSLIARPPSAELRPDQVDTDSLPPYDVLDPILEGYVERDQGRHDLIRAGFDPELVRDVARMVDLAEYKRRQAPPGVRIRPKAFGRDRRLPITNGFRG